MWVMCKDCYVKDTCDKQDKELTNCYLYRKKIPGAKLRFKVLACLFLLLYMVKDLFASLNVERKEYMNTAHKLDRALKHKKITDVQFEKKLEAAYEKFLAYKHKATGDIVIFQKLQFKARTFYWEALIDFYSGKITRQVYIKRRAKAIQFYEDRLIELGIGKGRISQEKKDEWAWKSLKLEMEYLPHNKIPMDLSIPENWEITAKAARATVVIMLEAFDYYHKNHVKTMKNNWRQRYTGHASCPIELQGYEKEEYSDITVSPEEIERFKRWRDAEATM